MAVGPKLEKWNERMKQIEESIDRHLAEVEEGVSPTILVAAIVPHPTYFELRHLTPKYIQAGWSAVEYVSDSRVGDHVRFTP